MALNSYTLNYGKWKKVSNAGESGSAWIKRLEDGSSNILIAHSDASITLDGEDEVTWAAAFPDLDINKSYKQPDVGISDTLERDNSGDIYYATILDVDETADIITDFVVPG